MHGNKWMLIIPPQTTRKMRSIFFNKNEILHKTTHSTAYLKHNIYNFQIFAYPTAQGLI